MGKRKIVRSLKSGQFVKNTAQKYNPQTVAIEEVTVKPHALKIGRSVKTGRFIKVNSARRHKQLIETVKRGSSD